MTMKSLFRGIDHIGLAVKDLDAATHTYGEILGFEISGEELLEERGLKVVFAETGNSRLELIAATREDSEISGFLQKRGEGIHHVCVGVEDIEAAVAEMTERGAHFARGGIQDGAHQTRVAFLHPKGTHGVLIELVQKQEESHHDHE
jgi:methylmalonyl-CoA epimerase